jgi:hypothetical protein
MRQYPNKKRDHPNPLQLASPTGSISRARQQEHHADNDESAQIVFLNPLSHDARFSQLRRAALHLFLHPNTGTPAIFGDELDAGIFEGLAELSQGSFLSG